MIYVEVVLRMWSKVGVIVFFSFCDVIVMVFLWNINCVGVDLVRLVDVNGVVWFIVLWI